MRAVGPQVTLGGPPAAVWPALTRPDEVFSWFGAPRPIDVTPGGRAAFPWTPPTGRDAVARHQVPQHAGRRRARHLDAPRAREALPDLPPPSHRCGLVDGRSRRAMGRAVGRPARARRVAAAPALRRRRYNHPDAIPGLRGEPMATVKLIEYAQASPEVRAVYDDIMATRKV